MKKSEIKNVKGVNIFFSEKMDEKEEKKLEREVRRPWIF